MKEQIEHNFKYYAPKIDQPKMYELIRVGGKELALLVNTLCPHSREKNLAITKLEEVIMWANAAIARN